MKKVQRYALYAVIVLFAASSLLLLPPVRNAIADRVYSGDDAAAEVDMDMASISVKLLENGKAPENGLYSSLKAVTVDPGYVYRDVISVANDGTMDEIVRVIVRKYWTDADGKRVDLSPSLIGLFYNGNGFNASLWQKDPSAYTDETDIYYLSQVLSPGKEAVLFDGIAVAPSIRDAYVIADDPAREKTLIAVYDYDGLTFCVDIEVQSVQAVAGQDAVTGVWGIDTVTVNEDGTIEVAE